MSPTSPAKAGHYVQRSRQVQQAENPVDRPDARERRDEAANPINQQIAAQHLRRALRPYLHATQRERHQRRR